MLEENNLLVSIIVRTKDRPLLLNAALKSIASQTYRPVEVVLVNDGGCDLDIEELKTILSDIPLNYIRLDKNTGRAHAGNVGIENAKGEYIGFLDDDDEFYPEHLETLTEALKKGDADIVYSDAENVLLERDENGDFTEKEKTVVYSQDFIKEMLLIQNYIPFMCLLFRKKVFDTARIDESFDLFEDWDLLINLSRQYSFEHIRRVTAKYKQWSLEDQVNRQALTEAFSTEAYQRILQRHWEEITPEIIHTYCRIKSGELLYLRERLQRAFQENQRIEMERQKTELEKQKIAVEKQRTEDEKNRLFHEYMGQQEYVALIHNSISWKLITRYRGIKQKLLPPGSGRRSLYDLCLKSMRVLGQEGIKGFYTRARRKLRFNIRYMRFKFRLKQYRSLDFRPERRISGNFGFIKKPVNIIMPVFNGYECIAGCINSIFKHTDLTYHSILIIDDKSTDQRVTDYLRKLGENKDNRKIQIIFHEENLGFVKTINEGMKSAQDDVIILNSDTIVTGNWVDKLQRAAYSKPGTATATPLSNYVTINGIPEPFKYNNIPLGMDIETFAGFLERTSLRYYPEVPAGVGFCMYIKRSVLDDMGYFDEVKFEKGYAEETDFCMRALKKGYIHVLDDATYIYHIGGVSFESFKDPEVIKEKNIMIENNLEILKTLHPEYLSLVDRALQENLRPVHAYINLRLALGKEKIESTLCDRSKT